MHIKKQKCSNKESNKLKYASKPGFHSIIRKCTFSEHRDFNSGFIV